MSQSRVDAMHRIELPGSQPGDVFDIQAKADGSYLLVRTVESPPKRPKTKEEVLKAMDEHPLNLAMSWEELRGITREL